MSIHFKFKAQSTLTQWLRISTLVSILNSPVKPLDEKDFGLWLAVMSRSTHICCSLAPELILRLPRLLSLLYSGYFPAVTTVLIAAANYHGGVSFPPLLSQFLLSFVSSGQTPSTHSFRNTG